MTPQSINELTPIEQEALRRFPIRTATSKAGQPYDLNEEPRTIWLSGATWQSEQRGMNKVKPCTCKESTGWTQVKCCNICGNPVEKFWTT